MIQGKERFNTHIQKIAAMLYEAKFRDNPALWLYENNFRTPIFMLEGLARLYAQMHNDRVFSKIKDKTKEIEDILGSIDHYDHLAKELSSNKRTPVQIIDCLITKKEKYIGDLNKMLKAEKWLSLKRLDKFSDILKKVNWKDEDTEIELIRDVYVKEIQSIENFLRDRSFQFANMEEDVHELRRKIRWLSIYPQALLGVVKLIPDTKKESYFKIYHTHSILSSPFNQLRPSKALKVHLKFSKSHFLALSWLIASLGEIKDMGLKYEATIFAYKKVFNLDSIEIDKKVKSLLTKSYPNPEMLLKKSGEIVQKFFSDSILDKLVLKK